MLPKSPLDPSDTFIRRHIGPSDAEITAMLESLNCTSMDELSSETIPSAIRLKRELVIGPPRGEHELLAELREMASQNQVRRSLIGMGYYSSITPPVIQRNILENPGWYTQYTPYQAEISQGRLEALILFQTLVAELTGLSLANASMLDEGTAAAEAMTMCVSVGRGKKKTFFVSDRCHPQTIEVVRTRAVPLGVKVVVGDVLSADLKTLDLAGVLISYPATDGGIIDFAPVAERVHQQGALLVAATDLLALTLLRPPGEFGADIAVGSSQRLGLPLGFGGPHAGFMATREKYTRKMPGRLIGVSRDAQGNPGYRLSLQTREQHIRRDRATSNICTAQVLLAIISAMYCVYHGPEGLRRIAQRVTGLTSLLAAGLQRLGYQLGQEPVFDPLRIFGGPQSAKQLLQNAASAGINLRDYGDGSVGLSLDELSDRPEVESLLDIFAAGQQRSFDVRSLEAETPLQIDSSFARTSNFLEHPLFNSFHSETEMLRYLHRLQSRDLSLATSMIPLGSCTMKLNGTSEMLPVTWAEFGALHPFAPRDQVQGYHQLFTQLEEWLTEITGFAACSLQPNAGSQGEYVGLLTIRAYHLSRGEQRDVCLVPTSAHGTNPASAVLAGFDVVPVGCDEQGNIDLQDLRTQASKHQQRLGALMITYPSTHGVFEEGVVEACSIVHEHGGQVYLDGANMNAQVGLCRPGDFGGDVCHLNLHKTFCIPHGGGGPGMGPICVAEHLAPFLPGHPLDTELGGSQALGPVSSAPYGSPSILPISWVYIALMGSEGLRRASQVAILSANYMAERLRSHYPILYTGSRGRVAHEFVVDLRPFKDSADIGPADVAKRLMDFGFHAPTMSWPVPGTLMIEPTESENKAELDRFCDAMITIRAELRAIEDGRLPKDNNPLKNAPHTAQVVCHDRWEQPYTREQAAFPAPWLRDHKFWPAVGRVDDAWGDRNLSCSCPPMEAYK
ncbi:MAG: glycine dehydrogenase (aminomethyl-transferring) [Rickettsiales bacterium]|nr:glycine dehydrogenase (aminomethyl-transferring) [Rickettsiales bacterium]